MSVAFYSSFKQYLRRKILVKMLTLKPKNFNAIVFLNCAYKCSKLKFYISDYKQNS